MKKNALIILIGTIVLMMSSCGVHNGLTYNSNGHNTEVQLSKNNFKVVKSIQGKATATYILGIGGLNKKALIANARAEMLKDAGLEGSSKAVINETVELQVSNYVLYVQYNVTVSAHVVEFTGN